MKVDINRVLELQRELHEINEVPLDEIEWTLDGKPLAVSARCVAEFRFTGLSNVSFVTTGSYQHATIFTNKENNLFDR
jgi:hypothetical protein